MKLLHTYFIFKDPYFVKKITVADVMYEVVA